MATRAFTIEKGYAVFTGDGEIGVESAMEPMLMQSAVEVYANLGTAAVQFGPLIFCAESVDQDCGVHSLYIDARNPDWRTQICERCGCPHITARGFRRLNPTKGLYYPLEETFEETRIMLIPYHAFANREESDILVYLRYRL